MIPPEDIGEIKELVGTLRERLSREIRERLNSSAKNVGLYIPSGSSGFIISNRLLNAANLIWVRPLSILAIA